MESEASSFELVQTQPSAFSWITRLSRTRVSSIGSIGFSSDSSPRLQGLDDVLKTVQKLQLPKYSDGQVERAEVVGQGETYLVERCIVADRVLAIKTLKLEEVSKDTTKFLRRLNSVLLELRVMYHKPLHAHPNILELVAYGWSDQQHRTLPYILVEFSPFGNFREYLQSEAINLKSKEILIGDVALGITALHLASIVHGDIKLENVLIFPSMDRPAGVAAKIADFGHSLLLLGADKERSPPKYEGTPLYNAPEVSSQKSTRLESSELYKCDVWAFGLLAWETLLNGDRYVKHIAMSSEAANTSDTLSSLDFSSLSQSAKDAVPRTPGTLQRAFLCGLFNLTLRVDPSARTSDLSAIPVISQWHDGATAKLEANLALHSGTPDWSFEMFRPETGHEILWKHQEQILHDFERCHDNATKQTKLAAESAWELALCHFLEFGTSQNLQLAADLAKNAQSYGHPIGDLASVLITSIPSHDVTDLQWYNSVIVQMFCSTPSLPWDTPLTFESDEDEWKQTQFSSYTDFSSWLSASLGQRDVSGSKVRISSFETPLNICETIVVFRDRELLKALRVFLARNDRGNFSMSAAISNSDENPLVRACRTGLPEFVSGLLACGGSPSARCSDGSNMFHWLFLVGGTAKEIVREELGKYRGDPSLNEPSHTVSVLNKQWPLQLTGTPIAYAIAAGSKEGILALLELGADLYTPIYRPGQFEDDDHRSQWNSFHLAVKYHAADILETIMTASSIGLPQSPVPYACALSFSSPIERRAMHGKDERHNLLKTIRIIAERKGTFAQFVGIQSTYELKRSTSYGISPLTQAIDFNDVAVVSALLEVDPSLAGAILRDPHDQKAFSFPVHFAAQLACRRNIASSTTILKLLSECSKNGLSELDSDRRSPLHLAVTDQYDHATRYILEKAPQLLDLRDAEGRTALIASRSAPNTEHLLSQGADIRAIDNHGRSALHYACLNEALDVVQVLVKGGADRNLQAKLYGTPLHCAILKKNREITSALLQSGAVVNACDHLGNTPLNMASRGSRKDLVRLLLDFDADVSLANHSGETPVCAAITSGSLPAVQILAQTVTADSVVKSKGQETALHLCARYGDARMMECFLAEPEYFFGKPRNSNGHNPFHIAAIHAQVDTGKLLLDAGLADVHEKDTTMNTACHLVLIGPNTNFKPPEEQQLAFLSLLHRYGAFMGAKNHFSQMPWDIALSKFRTAAADGHSPANSDVLVYLLENGGQEACRLDGPGIGRGNVQISLYLLDHAIEHRDAALFAALVRADAVPKDKISSVVLRHCHGALLSNREMVASFSNALCRCVWNDDLRILSQYMRMSLPEYSRSFYY